MIESKLGTRLWTHQDRIDNGIFSLNLSNADGLDIVDVLIACIYCIYLLYLLIKFDQKGKAKATRGQAMVAHTFNPRILDTGAYGFL